MIGYAARWRLIGIAGAAAIVVDATVYWASTPVMPASEMQSSAVPSPAVNDARRLNEAQSEISPAPQGAQAPADLPADPEESTIADYTAQKYQFLLDDLRYLDASQLDQLRPALQARERLSGQANSAEQEPALAKAEDRIRGILQAADYSTYEMLRESDAELFKLNEYAGGVSNVAPVSAADREAILKTKLAYKARFRQLLRDSGLERGNLGPAEREYAFAVASRALEDFRRSYLLEVRQYLANEEQYALLSNYEATEFKAELAQLQSVVNASSQGGS